MKILVAGGAGYVGSRLVPELVKDGHRVTVVDLLWFGNRLPPKATVVRKDVFALGKEDLKGFEQVIFLAGLSNDPMAECAPAQNFIYNSAAPPYLAYVSRLAGVKRFIYASSASVYGFTDGKPMKENAVPRSFFPYGISKFQGESGVMYFADGSFSVISLRKGTISGFAPRMRFDLIVNTMYMKAATEGKITINNPEIWRPVLGINDTVRLYQSAIKAPLSVSGVFNVSSGNFTVGAVGQKVAEHFKRKHGKSVAIEVKNIPDKRNYKISTEKAESVLGFKPQESIESILEDLDKHVGLSFDFLAEKYYNILVFKKVAGKRL